MKQSSQQNLIPTKIDQIPASTKIKTDDYGRNLCHQWCYQEITLHIPLNSYKNIPPKLPTQNHVFYPPILNRDAKKTKKKSIKKELWKGSNEKGNKYTLRDLLAAVRGLLDQPRRRLAESLQGRSYPRHRRVQSSPSHTRSLCGIWSLPSLWSCDF